jgi:hypothetical protein
LASWAPHGREAGGSADFSDPLTVWIAASDRRVIRRSMRAGLGASPDEWDDSRDPPHRLNRDRTSPIGRCDPWQIRKLNLGSARYREEWVR